MSLSFFRIERGLELDGLVQYLQGAGVPGTAGDTAAAPVGSVYTDNTDGSVWSKITSGTGTNKWQKLASEQYVNNALGASVSWRAPVVARDGTSTALPTGTPSSTILVDGVTVANNDRVLFSALTGGNGKNVYIYNQTTGTFVEDTNQESAGDAVYVSSGASAGKTYIYNGTQWVMSGAASEDELGFIRAFIGKGASGSEMPAFTSTNFVSNGTSLEAAIGALDGKLGANLSLGNFVSPNFTINANIKALDTQIGAKVLNGNHILAASSTNANIQALDTQIGADLAVGNFISAGDALSTAITKLDTEFGPNVAIGNFISSTKKVNQNIQALDTAIGASVTSAGVILNTNSVNQNIQALGAELASTTRQTNVTNVTSVQTIDSVLADSAKWLVRVEAAGNPANVYATEVYAVQNGTAADFTRYATLKLGSNIVGLVVSADLDAGSLRLRVASTAAVNVSARRVGVVV